MADVDAWMPLWIGDYLADTGDLTTEEHGAYLLLLMAMWRQGGRLPGDPEKLARTAKVAAKRWPLIWSGIGRFFDISGESVVQGRLALELAKATRKHDVFSARGKKGAASKHATSLLEAENKQMLSTSQVKPALCDGDLGSDPSGDPDLNPNVVVNPSRARDGFWPALRWKDLFGRAWIAKYGGVHYGMGDGDARGIARLGDLLDEMPDIERIGAQAKAPEMFSEFLASANPATISARHPFAFFVTAFGGLRVSKADPKTSPPVDPYCEFHRQPRSRGRSANHPSQTCPECQHVAVRSRPPTSNDPTTAADLLAKGAR